MASYGTLQVSDLLKVNKTSIIDYGVEDVYAAVQNYRAAYNDFVNDELDTFSDTTTERMIGTGGPDEVDAIMVDEYAVADAQKGGAPSSLGFPLRRWDATLQWTYDYMANSSPAELAAKLQQAMIGDMKKLHYWLRRALFTPTNSNFVDRLTDNMVIPVKALANGDGFPIPSGPNASTFNPATHNHYMGSTGSSGTTLAPADVDNLLNNVTEHYSGGAFRLYVPQDVAGSLQAPNAFPQFIPLVYQRTVPSINLTVAEGRLSNGPTNSRMIGMYREAEVWVKPWMPAATLVALNTTAGKKPLARRVPISVKAGSGDFSPIFENAQLPLQCNVMRRQTGFGVQNRVAAAVLAIGSSTYVAPNIGSPG